MSKGINAILGITIVVFTFILFYALLFKNVQGTSKDIILFVLGCVSTILSQVVSYYFGSSKGSADKNQMLSDSINNNRKNDAN